MKTLEKLKAQLESLRIRQNHCWYSKTWNYYQDKIENIAEKIYKLEINN